MTEKITKKIKPIVKTATLDSKNSKPIVKTATLDSKNSKSINDLLNQIEKMTILELNEFVEALKTKFNIQPLIVSGAAQSSGAGEKTNNDKVKVVLSEIGANKIAVIKALSKITKKGLMDAKKMLDKLPLIVVENQTSADAKEVKSTLETAGAVIAIK